MDRSGRSGAFHPIIWIDKGDRIRVRLNIPPDFVLVLILSWWQEKTHTLKRPGQEDKTFTITGVPLMVSLTLLDLCSTLTSSTGRLDLL